MKYIVGLFLIFQTPCLFALDGGVVSNGGDSIAADFVNQAYVVAKILRVNQALGVNEADFLAAVQSTKVISRDQLFLADNNREVDAINYPQLKLIEVSRTRWQAQRTNSKVNLTLVAHEYFGIMGLNDSSYQISHQLFAIQGEPMMVFKCKDVFQGVQAGTEKDLYVTNYDLQLYFYKDTMLRGQLVDNRGSISENAVFNMSLLNPRIVDKNTAEMPILVYMGLPMIHKMIQFSMVLNNSSSIEITAKYWRIVEMGQTPEIKTTTCHQETMLQTPESAPVINAE